MSEPIHPELFPIAYGNEEETMMLVGKQGDSSYSDFTEPESFIRNYQIYIPRDIKTAPDGGKKYLQNGGLIYDGGYMENHILERATPECSNPEEFVHSIEASEQILVRMAESYITTVAKFGEPETLRIHRRVVDSDENTRASHDSFEIRRPSWLVNFEDNQDARNIVMAHLATRSFMTGAGYVTPGGLKYAQKAQHVSSIDSYGYSDSAYRNASELETGARFEIRCSDINLSPWAIKARIGTAALLLTTLQTPLARELLKHLPTITKYEDKWITNFKRFNQIRMDNEGRIENNPLTIEAIDFNEQTLEFMGKFLPNFIELPESYKEVITEGIQYCMDFKKVIRGQAEIELVADRSDAAAKFSKISRSIKKSRDMGFTHRTSTDLISQAWDLHYDQIEVRTGMDGKPRVTYGYGYKHRDKGGFVMGSSQKDVDRAVYHPPKTTRAFVRGNMIRKGLIESCDWAHIKIKHRQDSLEDLSGVNITLPEVVLSNPNDSDDVVMYTRKNSIS